MGVEAARASLRRRAEAILDGEFIWGAIISGPSRYGAAQQRLIVYPPGISRDERRWLRAWRGWPLWGGVLWIVIQIGLRHVAQPWLALVTATGTCLLLGSVAYVMAGALRRHVRVLNACSYAAYPDAESAVSQRSLRLLTTMLCTADAQHERGRLSMVDYERVWWQVYDAMAPR